MQTSRPRTLLYTITRINGIGLPVYILRIVVTVFMLYAIRFTSYLSCIAKRPGFLAEDTGGVSEETKRRGKHKIKNGKVILQRERDG